jgi:hypothetical protein
VKKDSTDNQAGMSLRPSAARKGGVSSAPSDAVPDTDDARERGGTAQEEERGFAPVDLAPDDPTDALMWFMRWERPYPGYLKDLANMVAQATRCRVVALTVNAALWRGVEWLKDLEQVQRLHTARETLKRCGWSTSPLDWSAYTLKGCGSGGQIEIRHAGRVHSPWVHGLKDDTSLSLRTTAGLCVLFGLVDLEQVRGTAGLEASAQAKDFLAQLDSRVVLAEDLARRAKLAPASVTATSRDQLLANRHR